MSNYIVDDIRRKIYVKGENALIIFVGKVRKGKSLGAIKFAQLIQPNFDIKKQISFDIEDFYKYITDDETTQCVAIIEEMGLKADKREFMSKQNKILTQLFQIFAYKSVCVVMTVPSMSFVDGRIEHLIDYVFECDKTEKRKNKLIKVTYRVKRYQHNPVEGVTYKKRPFFNIKGRKMFIPFMMLHAPSEPDIQVYKALEKPYKDKVTVGMRDEMDDRKAAKVKKVNVGPDIDEVAEKIVKEHKDKAIVHMGCKIITLADIQKQQEGLTYRAAQKVQSRIKELLNKAPERKHMSVGVL